MKKFENLTLGYNAAKCDSFKESEISRINYAIAHARIGQYLCFDSYGHIDFDDEHDRQHFHPTVDRQETFTRKKCNGIVYRIYAGNDKYTHVVLYQNLISHNSSYGCFWLNENTNEVFHKIQIDYDMMDVLAHFNQIILLNNYNGNMKG